MTITAKLLKKRFPGLLNRCNAREAQALLEGLQRIEASPNQQLHRGGNHADSLYLIWEGSLALFLEADGEQLPLGTLGPGQFIGTVAVVEPGPVSVTVTVAERGILLRLDHSTLKRLRSSHPRLGGNLLRALSLNMAERLRVYEEYMTERTESPDDSGEFARLCRPLMGIKAR